MSRLLQQSVAEQAECRPGARAIVDGEAQLTYAELESASTRLARLLLQARCAPGDRVCLLAPRSTDAIVAMLGTLKAGCAYVPIDVASPAARVARIVRRADPAAALVGRSAVHLLTELRALGALAPDMPIVALDADTVRELDPCAVLGPEDAAAQSDQPLPDRGDPGEAAHILFTSGSTGEPKGVVITHANVDAFITWAVGYFGTGPGDRISGHPPLHFDLSTFDVYGTFRAGAELHLAPPDTLLPRRLADFISEHRLTQWFSVPSAMTYMSQFGALPEHGFPTLRRVIWCGEVLPTTVLVHWMRRLPQARFTNLYGPTEATIASSFYTVPGLPPTDTGPIPIGSPCAGEELFIIDGHGAPVADGESGELCIAGAGVALGYWRDQETTGAAFIADPRPGHGDQRVYRTGDVAMMGADGLFYFLGRTDSQIKSRGYRIELGEIEAAINAMAEVSECAVIGVDSAGFEGTAICCAFAPPRGVAVTASALRAALSTRLPGYMLPSRWESMDALPKNINGKIDRRRLRERFSADANHAPNSR